VGAVLDLLGRYAVTASPEEIIQVSVVSPQTITVGLIDGSSQTLEVAYHHTQSVSSNTWEIEHSLGFYPNITTMDSAGTLVEGELQHLTKYRLRVIFSAPISGQAFLS
jgi:hypothetical protein